MGRRFAVPVEREEAARLTARIMQHYAPVPAPFALVSSRAECAGSGGANRSKGFETSTSRWVEVLFQCWVDGSAHVDSSHSSARTAVAASASTTSSARGAKRRVISLTCVVARRSSVVLFRHPSVRILGRLKAMAQERRNAPGAIVCHVDFLVVAMSRIAHWRRILVHATPHLSTPPARGCTRGTGGIMDRAKMREAGRRKVRDPAPTRKSYERHLFPPDCHVPTRRAGRTQAQVGCHPGALQSDPLVRWSAPVYRGNIVP
jgi:hypothetical protein